MAVIIKATRTQVAQAVAPTPIRGGATGQGGQAFAQGVGAVGDMFAQWQDGVDRAKARNADTAFNEQMNQLMWAPDTGYMNTRGQGAIEGYKGATEALDGLRTTFLDNLDPNVRAYAEGPITARLGQARQSFDRHSVDQGDAFRMESLTLANQTERQAAIYNPAATRDRLGTIRANLASAAEIGGHDQAWVSAEFQTQATEIHSGIAHRIGVANPTRALEYLKSVPEAEMAPAERQRLIDYYQPKVYEYEGRNAGLALAQGLRGGVDASHGIPIDLTQMGPARPNAPDQPVLNVIGWSVKDVLGDGAKIVVTSGQEGDNPQHGSNRHKTGNAADVQILRPDGSVVLATDPEMSLIAKDAARNGAQGIGFGKEYMGGSHIHIDLVRPGPGQGNFWASGAQGIGSDLTDLMSQSAPTSRTFTSADRAKAQAQIDAIDNPVAAAAAQRAFDNALGQQEQVRAMAKEEAYNAVLERVTTGQSLDDPGAFTPQEEMAIGTSGMDALRRYSRSRGEVKTDPALYLRLTDLAGTDPKAFLAEDPMTWLNEMSPADYKRFTSMRNQVRGGQAADQGGGISMATVRSALAPTLARYSDKPVFKERLQYEALKWAEGVAAATGQAPTDSETMRWAMINTAKVSLTYLVNQNYDSILGIDFNNSTPDEGDNFDAADFDLNLARGDVVIGGKSVSAEVGRQTFKDLSKAFKRDPTPREMLMALARRYM